MWGAVTAVLSRKIMGSSYKPKIYQKMGDFVRDHLIFSYFYLHNSSSVLYPNYTEDGFGFGEEGADKYALSEDEFERKFISSYTSTALDKTSSTAEEGSLHEVELITDKDKESGENVELTGYLFTDLEENRGYVDNELPVSIENMGDEGIDLIINNVEFEVFNTIKKIQVGGERSYGFGWLELEDTSKEEEQVFGKEVDLSTEKPRIESEVALSHVVVKDKNENHLNEIKEIKGDLEPLVGREWREKKGAGQKVSAAKICLVPGTRFKGKSGIMIGEYGLWCIDGY